jgi:hypothetical protein
MSECEMPHPEGMTQINPICAVTSRRDKLLHQLPGTRQFCLDGTFLADVVSDCDLQRFAIQIDAMILVKFNGAGIHLKKAFDRRGLQHLVNKE